MGILDDFSERKAQISREEIKASWEEYFRKKKLIKDMSFYQKRIPQDPWDALDYANQILSGEKPQDEKKMVNSLMLARSAYGKFVWDIMMQLAGDRSVPDEQKAVVLAVTGTNGGWSQAYFAIDEGADFDAGWQYMQKAVQIVNDAVAKLGMSKENERPWAS
jgi:hypothetical protein